MNWSVDSRQLLRKVANECQASAQLKAKLPEVIGSDILAATLSIVRALKGGHKVLLCGNGGSAVDAQHIATELIRRLTNDRKPLPAIALTTNTSVLTAVGNDYGFEQIFARQVEALAQPRDIFIAISTGGHSANVIEAARVARSRDCVVIGLTGQNGGSLRPLANVCLAVPSQNTARIQEAHITIGHILCYLVEYLLFETEAEKGIAYDTLQDD